ncbi:hypothetical protein [Schlesneria paludicola]|uniref:hypothetical protein n=1 Tax=Schlesneria paludicola TaxID=360056 RepID=UPI000299FEFF|nr:hypothetical protein [Schlesneria paludicola]
MSERDSWNDPQSPSEVPVPPKKKGMSGCMLASLIVGGISFVGLLACCGLGGWFFSMVMPTITTEQAQVTAVAKKILNAEMLPDFTPQQAMTIDNMFFSMHIAEFKHKEGKGELMMGNVKVKIGDAAQANMQSTQFRGKFEDKMRETIDIKSSENHEVTMNGKKVNVVIGEGTYRATGKAVHTVTTDLEEGTSLTFLRLQMDDEIWNQDAVLKMLEGATPAESTSDEPKLGDAKPEDPNDNAAKPEEPKVDEPKSDEVKPE